MANGLNLKSQTVDIYIIMLFVGLAIEVYIEKNCVLGFEYGPGPQAKSHT